MQTSESTVLPHCSRWSNPIMSRYIWVQWCRVHGCMKNLILEITMLIESTYVVMNYEQSNSLVADAFSASNLLPLQVASVGAAAVWGLATTSSCRRSLADLDVISIIAAALRKSLKIQVWGMFGLDQVCKRGQNTGFGYEHGLLPSPMSLLLYYPLTCLSSSHLHYFRLPPCRFIQTPSRPPRESQRLSLPPFPTGPRPSRSVRRSRSTLWAPLPCCWLTAAAGEGGHWMRCEVPP